MKNQYSIHQVAELLGITTDAIRLYEKEGLVEPIRKEENGYRYYEVEQIHRILGIVLYRKLDVGLAEIKKLSGVSDFHGMCDAFDSLIQSNLSKIDYLQRKVEKMRFMKQHLEEIGQGVDTYRICSLASRYVLYPGLSTTADYKQIEEVLNSPVFQFGNFCYNIETESGREESLCFVVGSRWRQSVRCLLNGRNRNIRRSVFALIQLSVHRNFIRRSGICKKYVIMLWGRGTIAEREPMRSMCTA